MYLTIKQNEISLSFQQIMHQNAVKILNEVIVLFYIYYQLIMGKKWKANVWIKSILVIISKYHTKYQRDGIVLIDQHI